MNTRELNFAYKVRQALNEDLDNLPPDVTNRLAAARRQAVARKKKESGLRVFVPRGLLAGTGGALFREQPSWLARIGVVVPLVVLALGLSSIYQFEQQRRVKDLAEIDAAVLADELPLSAYVDHGFNAYLARRTDRHD